MAKYISWFILHTAVDTEQLEGMYYICHMVIFYYFRQLLWTGPLLQFHGSSVLDRVQTSTASTNNFLLVCHMYTCTYSFYSDIHVLLHKALSHISWDKKLWSWLSPKFVYGATQSSNFFKTFCFLANSSAFLALTSPPEKKKQYQRFIQRVGHPRNPPWPQNIAISMCGICMGKAQI